MGQQRKQALGPNPLAMKKKSKKIKKAEKPKRKRKGVRSKKPKTDNAEAVTQPTSSVMEVSV